VKRCLLFWVVCAAACDDPAKDYQRERASLALSAELDESCPAPAGSRGVRLTVRNGARRNVIHILVSIEPTDGATVGWLRDFDVAVAPGGGRSACVTIDNYRGRGPFATKTLTADFLR
jgi:hypothetical protein